MPYTRLMTAAIASRLSTYNGASLGPLYNGAASTNTEPTIPAVYLKANVTIKDGDGSLATPFILGIDE